MRMFFRILLLTALPWSAGCGRMVFTPSPQASTVTLTAQQQQALAMQTQQFQSRATQLDRNNQELEAMLAQSRQQMQLLNDQLVATQGQLRDTAGQLAAAQGENQELQSRSVAMAASIERQSRAEIRPNNSLVRNLTITSLPGVEVRQDGDVIRIELPGDQLFYSGSPQLKPAAVSLLQTVGNDVLRNYPQQLVGIEGHTDNTPPASPQYPTSHHLSVARAMAVYDALTRSLGATPAQFFVIGHGSNHPIMTNATPAGKARNNRVELVVYPESIRR